MNTEIPEHIQKQIQDLQSKGFEIIQADNPTEGVLGFLAYKNQAYTKQETEDGVTKTVSHEKEETETLEWPIFSKPLVCEENDVGLDEFMVFITSSDVYRCDKPKELKIGAIKYFPEEGKSEFKTIRISKIPRDSNGKVILKLIESLPVPRGHKLTSGNFIW